MRGRLPLFVILGASSTFLASLYLPWVGLTYPAPPPGSGGIGGLLNLLSAGGFGESWGLSSGFGGAACLVTLGLFAAAALELAGRSGTFRLPLPTAAFTLLFLSVMTGTDIWNSTRFRGAYDHAVAYRDIGMYLGLASAAAIFGAAVWQPALAFRLRLSVSAAAGTALTGALLASFLLPQLGFHVPHFSKNDSPIAYQLTSFGGFVQIAICLLACFSLPLWGRATAARERLAFTAAIALLTAGFLAPLRSVYSLWPWEFWLLLGCAVSLLVLALSTAGRPRVGRPQLAEAATVAAAVIFLASLFLPWETPACPNGACNYSMDGWLSGGSGAAVFTVVMLVGLLGYSRFWRELAIGAAVYGAAAGIEITSWGSGLRYGAPLGFAGATLLLFYALRGLRPIPQARSVIRIVPLAACLGFLSFIVAEMTRGLDTTFAFQSPWRHYELAAAAIVLVLRLLIRWSERPADSDEVVLLPLALLAVTGLDLLFVRDEGISWEGWASVLLCLVLALCGWAERYRGGLERFQIPEEIWRVDRISGAED